MRVFLLQSPLEKWSVNIRMVKRVGKSDSLGKSAEIIGLRGKTLEWYEVKGFCVWSEECGMRPFGRWQPRSKPE
jgi:hypothetical protein